MSIYSGELYDRAIELIDRAPAGYISQAEHGFYNVEDEPGLNNDSNNRRRYLLQNAVLQATSEQEVVDLCQQSIEDSQAFYTAYRRSQMQGKEV